MAADDLEEIAVLIYYPEQKLKRQQELLPEAALYQWYLIVIPLLVQMTNYCGKKYTRSKVRKTIPPRFTYIVEELLTEVDTPEDKKDYFTAILTKIIQLNQADDLICTLSETIRRLVVDHLHVVGDVYDRGPHPDKILDRLMSFPSMDVQWGNHDIIWMAISFGSYLAMLNAIRICARYGNLDLLEDSYGINLRPLIEYVQKYYQPQVAFKPHLLAAEHFSKNERQLLNQLQ